jgi:hypothetical protein
MGSRSVFIGFHKVPSDAVLEWVRQFCACAEWYGPGSGWELRAEEGGHLLEIQLDGNSDLLKQCTPNLCEAASTIARDIDPEDSDLAELASLVAQQLTEGLVPPKPGDRLATYTRPGREALERLAGEASVPALLKELSVHQARVHDDLHAIASSSGPTAWRARFKYQFVARVDALAVVNTARRLERVATDLRDRLRDPHLTAALRTFQSATRHVADIRNIAEHVDRYAIGRGHLDRGANVEPGDVIQLSVERNDVLLAARGRTVSVSAVVQACERLGSCLNATTSARFFELHFPEGFDIDFMVVEPDGSRRILAELNEEQEEFKEAIAAGRTKAAPKAIDKGACPTCGLKI